MATKTPQVLGGVDTHRDLHVAAAIDSVGQLLGHRSFVATPAGYRALLAWLRGLGQLQRVGVEGTGAYGAGLLRHLRQAGVTWLRSTGQTDAPGVARASRIPSTPRQLRGQRWPARRPGLPRAAMGTWRRSGRCGWRGGGDAGPHGRRQPARLPGGQRPPTAARNPAGAVGQGAGGSGRRTASWSRLTDAVAATKAALRRVAHRYQLLSQEIAELDQALELVVAKTAPGLVALVGVGTDVAGQLLVTAGDNPNRLVNEAAFAHLCGVAPLPVHSGRMTGRHRLSRGGDRAANNALYTIVICRLRWDPRTRATCNGGPSKG